MECWIRSSSAFVLGGVVLIGSGGCDLGQQAADSGPAGGASQPAQASNPSRRLRRPRPRKTQGELTTPNQRVDTKQLTEVVKEEVKGGEAQAGPTPFDYLWQPSRPELIKDEPLTVAVPSGFTPLVAKVTCRSPIR